MEFKELANLCERLEVTTKRNLMTDMVADFLRRLDEREVEPAVSMLLGRPFPKWDPRTLDISWATLSMIIQRLTGATWSDFSEASVETYRLEGEGLVGIPFAVYPSAMFYNRDLFDEAGLDYPPHEWGADYADGDPWDIAKLEELAMILTVDANGNDANSPDFDPENIVQFGYHTVWSDGLRTDCAALFGADHVIDENGKAYLSDDWRECVRWYYSGIHEKHFIPNQTYEVSDLLANDNTFDSGNLAMTHSHLWYTCCVEDVPNWDAAAVPSYNGELTSKLHADTFRIFAAPNIRKRRLRLLSG